MKKIVINRCYGGFGLSHDAVLKYAELKGWNLIVKENNSAMVGHEYYLDEENEDNYWYHGMIKDRSDPDLVKVVESLGEKAYGWAAELSVVEIPDDVDWEIGEYDGIEWVQEKHRRWY